MLQFLSPCHFCFSGLAVVLRFQHYALFILPTESLSLVSARTPVFSNFFFLFLLSLFSLRVHASLTTSITIHSFSQTLSICMCWSCTFAVLDLLSGLFLNCSALTFSSSAAMWSPSFLTDWLGQLFVLLVPWIDHYIPGCFVYLFLKLDIPLQNNEPLRALVGTD